MRWFTCATSGFVVGDYLIRRIKDVGGAAVVLLQLDDGGAEIPFQKVRRHLPHFTLVRMIRFT